MVKGTLILFVLLLGFQVNAQSKFFSIYSFHGLERGEDVMELSDGTFAVVGTTNSFNNAENQMYVGRLSSSGGIIWSKDFGGSEIELGKKVLNIGNTLYFFGSSNTNLSGDFNFQMVKSTLDGVLFSSNQMGTLNWDFLTDAVVLPDSTILLCGNTENTPDGLKDGYCVHIDTNGTNLQSFQSNLLEEDEIKSVSLIGDSALVYSGFKKDLDSNLFRGFILMKNLFGDTLWNYNFGHSTDYKINKTISTPNGLYAVGAYRSAADSLLHEFAIRLDFNGNLIDKYIGFDIGERYFVDACYVGNNQYFFTAHSSDQYAEPIGTDVVYYRFNANLGFDFSAVGVNVIRKDEHGGIFPTSDGGFVATGFTTTYGTGAGGLYVLKTEANGGYPDMQNPSLYTIVGLGEQETASWTVFPNPVTEMLTIKFDSSKQFSYEIIDAYGKTMRYGEIQSNQSTLKLDGFENGLYFLRITIDGKSTSKKILIQK
ncbi:MAG: T9SS type A sorting domain-containing protein [Bacteroidetes bacterium]|nr:T9SS type A sorting domain-containing protein [Bacteroidota bacterium]